MAAITSMRFTIAAGSVFHPNPDMTWV